MEDSGEHAHDSKQFVGSAVVTGASYRPRATILQLQTFTGEYIHYILADIPDRPMAAAFQGENVRPISVKIQAGGEGCSVIALTPDGPRRWNITLGTALALQQSGVYAVVDGGLGIGAPCCVRTPTSNAPLLA